MTVMVTVDGAASAAASAAAADDDYDHHDADDLNASKNTWLMCYGSWELVQVIDQHWFKMFSPLVTRDILLEISLDVYHHRWIIFP